MWEKFPKFFTQSGNGSFCQRSDASKPNRFKIIHTQGLTAKVTWKPVPNNGFTGFYETGSDKVLMRISEAQNLNEFSTGLTPAAAFKFFIDGKESENILVQSSFLQSNSWNFFEN